MLQHGRTLKTLCKVKEKKKVLITQLCLTPCNSRDCNSAGSSFHGILQGRMLECIAISYSRGSSWPRGQIHVTCISCIGRRIRYYYSTWEARGQSSSLLCLFLFFQRTVYIWGWHDNFPLEGNCWMDKDSDICLGRKVLNSGIRGGLASVWGPPAIVWPTLCLHTWMCAPWGSESSVFTDVQGESMSQRTVAGTSWEVRETRGHDLLGSVEWIQEVQELEWGKFTAFSFRKLLLKLSVSSNNKWNQHSPVVFTAISPLH